LTAPVSGVITRWKSNVAIPLPPEPISYAMQVLRQVSPLQFTVVAQSPTSLISSGQNSFPVRIPVQAGDRIGLSGVFVPLFCQTGNPADAMGVSPGTFSPGAAVTVSNTPGYRVPVAALIEPDVDNDGFGDETQDGCPRSAALQIACPLVNVETTSEVRRNSVAVLVATSSAAPVQVTGTVKLGKGKKATLKAAARTVTPGTLAKFRLNFNKKLRDRLKELSPNQKLTLRITTTATDLAGQLSTDKVNAKLKGQG